MLKLELHLNNIANKWRKWRTKHRTEDRRTPPGCPRQILWRFQLRPLGRLLGLSCVGVWAGDDAGKHLETSHNKSGLCPVLGFPCSDSTFIYVQASTFFPHVKLKDRERQTSTWELTISGWARQKFPVLQNNRATLCVKYTRVENINCQRRTSLSLPHWNATEIKKGKRMRCV